MENILTIDDFATLVFEFRGKRVMLDTDLAALYETETKKLKQQVKRNLERFPTDFMFELSRDEKRMLITSQSRLIRLKYSSVNPIVFTEQGVAMLSSVLTSSVMSILRCRISCRYFFLVQSIKFEHSQSYVMIL